MKTSSVLFLTLFILFSFLDGQLSAQKKDRNKLINNPEELASYPGGQVAYESFLEENIEYPISALKDTIQGEVLIGFIVEKDGGTSQMSIIENIGNGCGLEAARVLTLVKKWNPAMDKGQPVRSYFTAKVKFEMPSDFLATKINIFSKDDIDLENGDVLPAFPGEENAIFKFLMHNLRYPDLAMETNTQGKVYIKFLVQKDGSLSNYEIIKGIGAGCDLEAVRVLIKSPKWNPGMKDGEPVDVWMTFPFNFQLQ